MILREEYQQSRLLAHVDRLAAWQAGKPFPPIRVNVSPSGNCNHRCRFCYVDYLRHPHIAIDDNVLNRVCGEMADYGVRQLLFEGIGEPLLNPCTIDAMIRARERGCPSLYLVTNGTLFTPEVFSPLLPYLNKCDSIRISAPESTPKLYAKTHGCSENEWHKLVANLEALQKDRTRGTLITTIYPTVDGIGTLRDAVRMAMVLGADIVSITPPILKAANADTQDYRQDLRSMHKAEMDTLESMSTDTCLVTVNTHWFNVIENATEPPHCDGVDFYTCIGPDAKVYPCFRYWLNEEYAYGDLNRDTFKEVWESKQRADVRKRVLAEGHDDGTLCRNCVQDRMYKDLKAIKFPSRFAGAI